MFLFSRNINKKLINYTTNCLKNNKIRHQFRFSEKFTLEKQANNQPSAIDMFFTDYEKYITKFYEKHKNNLLYKEYHDQEFEVFINKMEYLLNLESEKKKQIAKYISNMNKISLHSREPLREVMIYYQMFLTGNGFFPEALSETMLHLGKVYQSRENYHRVYSDYTHWDFINSHRMYHIIDDFKFGLSNDNSYMSLNQIADCIRGLTLCGYKNTELVNLIFERIFSFVNRKKLNKKYDNYAETPGAGKYKYNVTNIYAEDVFYQENFKKNVKKLFNLNFIDEPKELHTDSTNDVMKSLDSILNLLRETKEIQHTLTDSIDNLLDQYYKIEQSLFDNPELKDNPYIKYEIYKLQDKLFEGGYLTYDIFSSIASKKLSSDEMDELRFKNMISILKEFFLVHFQNLYNEGEMKLDELLEKEKPDDELISSREFLSFSSLGKVLAALVDYCKIVNLDINNQDYCNEKIVKEFVSKPHPNNEQIQLKSEYTKLHSAVENFLKKFQPYIIDEIKKPNDTIEAGCGYIYYAYSSMNLLDENFEKILLGRINSFNNMNKDELSHIIMGLARAPYRIENKSIMENKINKLQIEELHSIEEMINLLWSLSIYELFNTNSFHQILLLLSEKSEQLVNYVTNTKHHSVYINQLSISLKYEAERSGVVIPNNLLFLKDLHYHFNDTNIRKLRYGDPYKEISLIPNEFLIDPEKDTLLKGMHSGMFNKENQKHYINSLTELESSDVSAKIPFFPNFLFGFYGNKVAVFVLGKDRLTGNNLTLNGSSQLISRILLNSFNIHSIILNPSDFLNLDLDTGHMNVSPTYQNITKDNHTFSTNLEKMIAEKIFGSSKELNKLLQVGDYLNKFIKKIADSEEAEIIFKTESSEENTENFLNSFLEIIDIHSELYYSFHKSMITRKLIDFKVAINKSHSSFKSLSNNLQLYINKIIQVITSSTINYGEFLNILARTFDKLNQKSTTEEKFVISESWLGMRLNVDVISEITDIKEKNIGVEFINHNYMWLGEYNPYNDWEEQLQTSYDNFNYFVENGKNKYLFKSNKFGPRNVPNGVFPHPNKNKYRIIKKPLLSNKIEYKSSYEQELKSYINYNQTVVAKEIVKNSEMSETPYNEGVSMMVNLLNIKNCLKQNMSENDIITFLSKFEFIDNLIDEHLNKEKFGLRDKTPKLLNRDPIIFMNFYKKLSQVRDEFDEYDKFIMKEYYNQQKIFEIDPNLSSELRQKQLEDRMMKKIEELEDNDAVSIYNPNVEDYKLDINSIFSSVKFKEIDSDYSKEIYRKNPELFLYQKRILAERNIILLKIVINLIKNDMNVDALSQNEKTYLQMLINKIETSNINHLDSVGLKTTLTSMRIENLSGNDLYALNSLYNVEIDKQHNNYSLSELILELSHFIDGSTINKILYSIYDSLYSNNTQLNTFHIQNKEPNLLAEELKESVWRLSGYFDESDREKIKNLLRIKRGKGVFDKIWLEIDEKSFNDFIREYNGYENRIQAFEKWVKRKEREVDNRINLPPDNLKISDHEIKAIIDKKDKAYRKSILFNIFQVDDLIKIDCHRAREFIDTFCSNLYMFNFNYPQSIRDIFNSLEDIQSLFEEDRQLLKNYRLFFKIDENNPFEFLSVNPIKLETEKMLFKSENVVLDEFLDHNFLSKITKAKIPFFSIIGKTIIKLKN